MVERRAARLLRRVVTGTLAGLLVLAIGFAGYEVVTWPQVAELAHRDPSSTAFIDRARARGLEVRWQRVPYNRMAHNLKRAVVVAEDINFFSHGGFDAAELRLAARQAIEGKRFRGASTITQQLAKNLWLSPSRSPLRKLKEAILTRQLERHLDKRRILELYLNVVELGPGIFGAEAAANHFFDAAASDLDEHQAAQLAASLPRPSSWHPGCGRRGYALYVEQIERRMDKATWLNGLL